MTNLPRIVYFDNAATTPMTECSIERMTSLSREFFGNPSSTHFIGRKAFEIYESAQDSIAKIFNVPSSHILFTSGGTESNNLALWGTLGGLSQAFPWIQNQNNTKLLTSTIEHDATKKSFETIESLNAKVGWIGVDSDGMLDLNSLEDSLNSRIRYASFHHVQNEIGICQNIKAASELIHSKYPDAVIHIDAVQSFLKTDLNMDQLGVDLVSVSAHKLGGPKGVGLLVLGKRFEGRTPKLGNLIYGSSQQQGIRPGTIAVPLIAGMVAAIEHGHKNLKNHQAHLTTLSEYLIEKLPPKAVVNTPKTRAPQTVNFSVVGLPSGVALEAMSARGFCISSGSACHSANPKPNETIMKMGLGSDRALSALRVSFGPQNTLQEVDLFVETLQEVIDKYEF